MHLFGSVCSVDRLGRVLPMCRIHKKRSQRMFLERPLLHRSGEAIYLVYNSRTIGKALSQPRGAKRWPA